MSTNKVLSRVLLMIILCLCVWANFECCLAQSSTVSRPSWVWNDGNLTGRGAGWAGYNESCGEGDLNLSFNLERLEGEMRANININGTDRYAIGFRKAMVGEFTYTIQPYVLKMVGETIESDERGITKSYYSSNIYQITIISKITMADSAAISRRIRTIEVYIEDMGLPRLGSKPLISYTDSDPLPPGGVDFESLEGGAYVEIYDIVLTCPSPPPPNQLPIVTSLIRDPTHLRVDTDVGWAAEAYDTEEDDIYYSFWLKGPATKNIWELGQNWSTSNQWDWNPSQRGIYRIGVYATDGRHSAEEIIYSNGSWRDALVYVDGRPPILGAGDFDEPDPENLTNGTSGEIDWGPVPVNEVLIVVNKNKYTFEYAEYVADQLANQLNGSVVGKLECINMFQIRTNRTPERDGIEELIGDINTANSDPDVDLAFPNQLIYRGSSASPLNDQAYKDGRCGGYDKVCVQEAWNRINESDVALQSVTVGVIDDGIFKWDNCCEFDNTSINTTVGGLKFAPAELKEPLPGFPIAGSHGTGIMNILAADPDDGGLVGIASKPLGDKLEVNLYNIYPPHNTCFSTSGLLALKYAVENGSSIISCSWGRDEPNRNLYEAYKSFFEEVYKYPGGGDYVLFVCSAGNNNEKIKRNGRIPGGMERDNMITVGNIMNNGDIVESSNRDGNHSEVTLAAPGQEAVWGRNGNGTIRNWGGGTSMATPQVTAAAAIIRSIRPDFNAKEIKDALRDMGSDGVDELGGKTLNISRSVDYVIDNMPETIQYEDRAKPTGIYVADNDDEVGQDTTPEVAEWELFLVLQDGTGVSTADLDLTRNDATVSGRGSLDLTSADQNDKFTSSKSECGLNPEPESIKWLHDTPKTSSQRPVEVTGSFDGINLNLSMISLNDNVRYELTLLVISGSKIQGSYQSFDSLGRARSGGSCNGTLKTPSTAASDHSQDGIIRLGRIQPIYST